MISEQWNSTTVFSPQFILLHKVLELYVFNEKLSANVFHVANTFFQNKTIGFCLSNGDQELFYKQADTLKWTIVFAKQKRVLFYTSWFIFLSTDNLNNMTVNANWNVKGKIVVYCFKKVKLHNLDITRYILDMFWRRNSVIDIVVGIVDRKMDIHFYTWFPFQRDQCRDVNNIVYLDSWVNGAFVKQRDLFPSKVVKNFNGCEIYTACINRILYVNMNKTNGKGLGVELAMVTNIADYFNMTLKQVTLTTKEDITRVLHNNADLTCGCHSLTLSRYTQTSSLYPYLEKKIMLYYHKPKPESHWKNIFRAFSASLWILIAASAFLLTSSFHFLINYSSNARTFSIVESFLQTFAITLRMSVPTIPTRISTRLSFFVLLIYGIHITAAYESSLISLLTKLVEGRKASSLDDLFDWGYNLVTRKKFEPYLSDTYGEKFKSVHRSTRIEYESDRRKILERITAEKAVTLISEEYILLQAEDPEYSQAASKLTVGRIPFMTNPVTCYMSKDSPLVDLFDRRVQAFVEMGMIVMWFNKFYREYITEETELTKIPVRLSFNHLQGAFYILLAGLSLALLFFILEQLFSFVKYSHKHVKHKGWSYNK